MSDLWIILIIIGIIIAVIIVIIIFITYILPNIMEKNAQPLTEDEIRLCEEIIKNGKGYPFVCKRAVRNKKCPCLPCDKLEKAKQNIN